jgi:transcriptional regulator with XRE-family HTH domain
MNDLRTGQTSLNSRRGVRELGLLARLRREAGKSQRRLAEALCDVSGRDTATRHEVSRWERGGRVPTSWLPYLATVLNVPLDGLERVLANSLHDTVDAPGPSPQLMLSDLPPGQRSGKRTRPGEGSASKPPNISPPEHTR